MSESMPRLEPVASVASATERNPAVIRVMPLVSIARSGSEAPPTRTAATDRSAAVADYAKIQANIADVLSRLQPSTNKTSTPLEAANDALVALTPDPVIILPMPPTDPQMVAFVAQVAQSMARQVAQTRAAQANATPILMEAAAS